jgi:hypothetical protein
MKRLLTGAVLILPLLAGCNDAVNSGKTESKDTRIQRPRSDINIHREKTETPSGTKEHIEIQRKDKQ